jgi:hypothetical protein
MMTDKEALELSIKIASRDKSRAGQLQEMLAGKPNPHGGWFIEPSPWEKVAAFAAYCCQAAALKLSPHEIAPCNAHVDCMGDDSSVKLLAKMEAAGVSRWHPDPLAACERQGNANHNR